MWTGAAEGVGYLGAAIWGEVRLPGGRREHAARLGSGTLSGDCRWGGCTGPNRGADRGRKLSLSVMCLITFQRPWDGFECPVSLLCASL